MITRSWIWPILARMRSTEDLEEALNARLSESPRIRAIVVRSLSADGCRIETDFAAHGVGAGRVPETPIAVPGDAGARLLLWFRGSEYAMLDVLDDGTDLRLLLPLGIGGAVEAWPLGEGTDGTLGVVLFAYQDPPMPGEAMRRACRDLREPLAVARSRLRWIHAMEDGRAAAEAEAARCRSRLGVREPPASVVGAETGLSDVMDRVRRVAPTDAPVVLFGETGSGKEVVARAIHEASRRVRGPFLKVNCGAMPPDLVDADLFGHERGGFTGAVTSRPGWFERAHGGTLFLDEVAELTPAAQVRLLRVLQDGAFERVGGHRVMHADVRIVAATHRDVSALVSSGEFREDLWYRLGVFPVRIPPLRERPGDIAPLAIHFAARAGERIYGAPLVPDAEDLRLLRAHRWPGNVRELASVLDRAAILGGPRRLSVAAALGGAPVAGVDPGWTPGGGSEVPRDVVTRTALGDEGGRRAGPPLEPPGWTGNATEPVVTERVPAATRLDVVTSRHIRDVLQRCLGRIDGPFGAASALGVHPATLRSRMARLGIDWKSYRRTRGGARAPGGDLRGTPGA